MQADNRFARAAAKTALTPNFPIMLPILAFIPPIPPICIPIDEKFENPHKAYVAIATVVPFKTMCDIAVYAIISFTATLSPISLATAGISE